MCLNWLPEDVSGGDLEQSGGDLEQSGVTRGATQTRDGGKDERKSTSVHHRKQAKGKEARGGCCFTWICEMVRG